MSFMKKDFDPDKHKEETNPPEETERDSRWDKTYKPERQLSLIQRLAQANTSTRIGLGIVALALLFLVMIGIWRAYAPEPIRPTTMNNTAELVRLSLKEGNYDGYKQLFKDNHQDAVLETDFRNLSRLATDQASSADYSVLRMSNGRMLLIAMEQKPDNDEYSVLFVVEIPTAMKELFTDRSLSDESVNMIPVPVGEIPTALPTATEEPSAAETEATTETEAPRETTRKPSEDEEANKEEASAEAEDKVATKKSRSSKETDAADRTEKD